MVVRAAAEWPAEFPFGLRDRKIVDAREAALHQAGLVEFPVLVAVAAEPAPRVVVPLVSEAHRDAVACARPQFLDEPVVELPGPLALQERAHLIPPRGELRAISPARILRVHLHDALGIAGVPGILGHTHLLGSRLEGERRDGRARRHGDLLWLLEKVRGVHLAANAPVPSTLSAGLTDYSAFGARRRPGSSASRRACARRGCRYRKYSRSSRSGNRRSRGRRCRG